MALNTSKCNHLPPLPFKVLNRSLITEQRYVERLQSLESELRGGQ